VLAALGAIEAEVRRDEGAAAPAGATEESNPLDRYLVPVRVAAE
jgi:hypothetical protein